MQLWNGSGAPVVQTGWFAEATSKRIRVAARQHAGVKEPVYLGHNAFTYR